MRTRARRVKEDTSSHTRTRFMLVSRAGIYIGVGAIILILSHRAHPGLHLLRRPAGAEPNVHGGGAGAARPRRVPGGFGGTTHAAVTTRREQERRAGNMHRVLATSNGRSCVPKA